jgi:hypothetical protein
MHHNQSRSIRDGVFPILHLKRVSNQAISSITLERIENKKMRETAAAVFPEVPFPL